MNKYKEEQIGQSRFLIPRYNLSLYFCIPNMNFLSYTDVEMPLTKNVERTKNGLHSFHTIYEPLLPISLSHRDIRKSGSYCMKRKGSTIGHKFQINFKSCET